MNGRSFKLIFLFLGREIGMIGFSSAMAAFEENCSKKMKVLADQTRLSIVRALMAGPMQVTEINRHVNIPQSLLSHHLKVLRTADLVTSRRQGKSIIYRLSAASTHKASPKSIDLGCCTLSFGRD